MAPFGSARKTGMAAATAASRRGAAGMQAKRARAAGVSGVDENAPPPARRPGRRACAQDGARRLGRVLSRRRCRHRRRCGRGSAVTSPAPMMAALARSAATRSPLGDVAAAVVASAVRTVAQAPPPPAGRLALTPGADAGMNVARTSAVALARSVRALCSAVSRATERWPGESRPHGRSLRLSKSRRSE